MLEEAQIVHPALPGQPREQRRGSTNITAHPVPRAKRQRVRGQPELDSSTSSGDDSEVFDEVPLTRADIPKIVEAVMNQFSSDPREEMRDSPHLGKLVYNFALHI